MTDKSNIEALHPLLQQALVSRSAVFNMDCIELMKQVPNKFFNLAIVDPPYGVRDKWKTGGVSKHTRFDTERKMAEWDIAPDKSYFDELRRVSKNQIIWGANHFPEQMMFSRCWIVWDKLTGDNGYGDCELAYTSFDRPIKKYTRFWLGAHAKEKEDEKRIHPTQKPISLYEWILKEFASEGDLILDTHLGSGSSRIAAYKNGYTFIGCELDTKYFEQQEARFKNFTAQQTLW